MTLKDEYGQESNSDPYVFNVYELEKAFIFGKYTNLTTEGDYITIEAVNLRLFFILLNPFQFQWLHHVDGEKVTYVKDTANALIGPKRIIGFVDIVTCFNKGGKK